MDVDIKICGLTRPEDARAAEEAGAKYGGVILAPGSPRTVAPELVASIFADSTLVRCGVFVNESPARIVELAARLALDVVQLHGDEDLTTLDRVRAGAAGVEVWKAIRPRSGEEFFAQATRFAGSADGILVDGWSSVARGGTGARFPWAEVASYRSRLDPSLRLIVAGGLDATNVAEVVAILAPDVVDVSSGVESAPGIKDPASIRRFAEAALGRAPAGSS